MDFYHYTARFSEHNVEELVRISLVRACFGELLSQRIEIKVSSFDMFLTGMFSLMDALMNISIEEILIELPISNAVKEALLKKKNILFELLNLIIEYENGNWDVVNELSVNLGLSEKIISDCYLNAIQNLQNLEKL